MLLDNFTPQMPASEWLAISKCCNGTERNATETVGPGVFQKRGKNRAEESDHRKIKIESVCCCREREGGVE